MEKKKEKEKKREIKEVHIYVTTHVIDCLVITGDLEDLEGNRIFIRQ